MPHIDSDRFGRGADCGTVRDSDDRPWLIKSQIPASAAASIARAPTISSQYR
jgi:hypothetical protein